MEHTLVEQFRTAVGSGEFPKAQSLWEEFARRLRGEIERGEIGADDMAAAAELVRWAAHVAAATRAQAAEQLSASRGSARVSQAYGEREKRGASILRKNL